MTQGVISIWDTFPQATFNGIAFPVESSKIEGGQRDHVHEYPHSPGGAPELLGRKLYVFHVRANFDTNFANYPGLYPQGLDTLLGYFEQGTTGPLRLSQMPSAVPCYAYAWTREQTAKVRSGERCDIVFREDQSTLFLFEDLVSSSSTAFTQSAQDVSSQLASVQSQLTTGTLDLFGQLAACVSNVVSWAQQTVGQFESQYNDAVLGLQIICGNIDTAPDMQTATTWPLTNAMHDLWAQSIQQAQQQSQAGAKLSTWVNPITQDMGSISNAIYGDSTHVGDLLSLNPVPDPLSVRAGTAIVYFASP